MSDADFEERRSSARLDMEEQTVLVTWNDENHQSYTSKVICSDVSQGGLKLAMPNAISVESYVDVQLTPTDVSSKTFKARVIRCTQLATESYEIGLKFVENKE